MGADKKKPVYNIKRTSSTGYAGIYYQKDKTKPYRAAIQYQKQKYELGRFLTLEEAIRARKEAEKRLGITQKEKEKITYLKGGAGKVIDLTGKKYPHFKVIKFAGKGSGRITYWACLCECGNTFVSTSTDIREGKVTSCGCIQSDPNEDSKDKSKYFKGTFIPRIQNRKPNKNNKFGIKGVMQDKHGTWYAILSIRKEKHFVRCDSKEQALYQRAMLEKKYYDPIIKEYLEKKNNGGNEK